MGMKKLLTSKILWVIIIIVAIGGGILWRNASSSKKPEYVTEAAKIDNIVQTVSATGKVKSASEIELNFKNAGTIIKVSVKTGDQVAAGNLIAQLKATDLQIAITKAQANLQEARANLARVAAGSTSQEVAVTEATVAKASSDLDTARADLDSTEKTYRQTLENSRQDLLDDLNAALTKANISLQKIYDTLFFKGDEKNFSTSNFALEQAVQTGYSDGVTKVTAAQSAYSQARLTAAGPDIDQATTDTIDALDITKTALKNLSSLFDYVILNPSLLQSELDTLKTTINTERTTTDASSNTVSGSAQAVSAARISDDTKVAAAKNAVTAAEKNLAKAQADLNLKQAPARIEDIALYQARVRQSEADLRLAQDRFTETILRAPIGGVITEVNGNPGEQTSLSAPVIKMLATKTYEIEVDIPESDIAKVTVGNQTDITLDAFADENIFKGTVTTINPAQTEIQDVIYYRVTVSFNDQQPPDITPLVSQVKPGMTANVTIETNRKESVLVIPSRAIKEQSGQKIVSVLTNGQPVEKTVTVGLRGDEGLVEIQSGLQAGDAVITFVRNQ